ncbi:hypothetical protein [Lewinella sp. IMCC34183]|uniref:hypothetical protein n=1 Tax=Lewinella sp. IMCC34183 TaxID=2248762 RepID=UPI000E232EF2|nr:hypothetical protein [Lewinella sp. IMCC34183]
MVADCAAAVTAAKGAGFHDRGMLEVIRPAADCQRTPVTDRFAAGSKASVASYHALGLDLVLATGDDVNATTPSAALGYLWDYGLWGAGHLRLLTGLGVVRAHYKERFQRESNRLLLYGQLLAGYTVRPKVYSLRIGLGYTVYRKIWSNVSGANVSGNITGYYSVQLASQGERIGVSVAADLRRRRAWGSIPSTFLKLGVNYRL